MKKRFFARFFYNVYWFLIQGRTSLKQSFEDVYNIENMTPTFRQIYTETFGEEYAEDEDPCGFTTKTDLENIKKHLDLKPDDLFADIACGRGGNGLAIARDLGVRLKGLDLSEKAVQIATKRIKDFGMENRAEYISGDMRDLPYKNEEFDAALCVDTLYMVPDKQAALQEIRRVLKRNRPLIILTWEMNVPFAVK
jgi:SAM-dependent methyltransferase